MIVVKKSITRNDDLCNALVVSGIGISYLTLNNIKCMAKKQEDKRRRRTMSFVRALLAVRKILAMVKHRQKKTNTTRRQKRQGWRNTALIRNVWTKHD